MSTLIEQVEEIISGKHLLKHPFYQAWQMGTLTIPMLQGYAKQYFHHIKREGQYVSGAHSNCDNIKDRQVLLENIREEDEGAENHPELWLRFTDALGLKREEVFETFPFPTTSNLVSTFISNTKNCNQFAIAAVALYVYESQVPEIAEKKIEGLLKHYGISEEKAVQFFTTHIKADTWHRQVGREMVQRYGQGCEAEVLAAANECANALWGFMDGVYSHYVAPASA